jgi:magnesium-dependent phosphatase 1
LVFDLDGCLWKPELFELLACRDGAPFLNDPSDTIPGTCMLSRNGEKVELLGDARLILYELYSQEQWYPSRVGISSRTDPPEWAHELMAQFSIYNPDVTASQAVTCSMKEVFDRSLCILDKTLDKAKQFEMLLEQANSNNVSTNNKSKKLKFKDIIFFDNEAGNCKQVARLGVTCVYTPRGLTYEAWENGLRNFPANRVLGPKAPY